MEDGKEKKENRLQLRILVVILQVEAGRAAAESWVPGPLGDMGPRNRGSGGPAEEAKRS